MLGLPTPSVSRSMVIAGKTMARKARMEMPAVGAGE